MDRDQTTRSNVNRLGGTNEEGISEKICRTPTIYRSPKLQRQPVSRRKDKDDFFDERATWTRSNHRSFRMTYRIARTSGYARARCRRQRNSRATVERCLCVWSLTEKGVVNPLLIIGRINWDDANCKTKRNAKRGGYILHAWFWKKLLFIGQASKKIWNINFRINFWSLGVWEIEVWDSSVISAALFLHETPRKSIGYNKTRPSSLFRAVYWSSDTCSIFSHANREK